MDRSLVPRKTPGGRSSPEAEIAGRRPANKRFVGNEYPINGRDAARRQNRHIPDNAKTAECGMLSKSNMVPRQTTQAEYIRGAIRVKDFVNTMHTTVKFPPKSPLQGD
jgi:hypothetical protein